MSDFNWSELPFSYIKTNYNVRCYYRNGKWGEIEIHSSEYINLHMSATCLHYGQEAFEGLKAYMGVDGKIRIFRMNDNAHRMVHSSRGILMEPVPENIFQNAVMMAVEMNKEFVPPYGSGASLYIRPLLIGSGPEIGVRPSAEYLFMVFVTPVGPYFKGGFKPSNLLLTRKYDRAAPHGTGNFKVGGNYAASMRSGEYAKSKGYSAVLYLDSKEQKYIDECGPANFFGIKNNTYITPKSDTILPSITNKSLIQLTQDMGMKVERRQVPVEELDTFEEVGACGTAAVISPIGKIVDEDLGREYVYSADGKPGEVCEKLYRELIAIQYGEKEDAHDWITILE